MLKQVKEFTFRVAQVSKTDFEERWRVELDALEWNFIYHPYPDDPALSEKLLQREISSVIRHLYLDAVTNNA